MNRICKDAFSVAGAVQETSSSELLGGPGADFLRGVVISDHQIFRFAKMILRIACSTSYDLGLLFRGRRSTLSRWNGKITKRIGTRPSAPHSTFHFWRKSYRIISFLIFLLSKNQEILQNCFVFILIDFEHLGNLVDLFRFWRYYINFKIKKIFFYTTLYVPIIF